MAFHLKVDFLQLPVFGAYTWISFATEDFYHFCNFFGGLCMSPDCVLCVCFPHGILPEITGSQGLAFCA